MSGSAGLSGWSHPCSHSASFAFEHSDTPRLVEDLAVVASGLPVCEVGGQGFDYLYHVSH